MTKFIISTDSCADYLKSEMNEQNIYCLPIKRIHGDKVYEELYDKPEEFDEFYEGVKSGKLSSTSQTNPEEFLEYFNALLSEESEGDIIHITLSSGISGTYNSAVLASNEINEKLTNRKIYIVDSLMATVGQMMLVEKLLELNGTIDSGKAIKIVEEMRNNQQAFFMVDDLNHLKRGGRISATKALLGTILGVKPILTFNKQGKIVPCEKAKGNIKAIKTILELAEKHKDPQNADFSKETAYIVRTSKSDSYENLKTAVINAYPNINLKEVIVGPVVGTHLGCGGIGFVFIGKPRLDLAQ
ncbi:MAG: DegV family protein [Firmicutes bacterium]|nr:DegV family protein [Bacillota bacterium]